MKFIKLNNGVEMPMQGIGTFLLSPDEAEASATYALKNGCQLIDTANAYCNEKAVGRAMKNAGIDRKNIFLETKLWPSFYEQEDAVDKTLERLQTDYIDLLLIHQPAGNYIAGYKQMEKAYKEGNYSLFFITFDPPKTADIFILSSLLSTADTSSLVNIISAEPAFSISLSSFLVPGIGTIYGFLHIIHASEICAGVAFLSFASVFNSSSNSLF